MVSMQHYRKLATALLLSCSLTALANEAPLPPGSGLLAEANQAFSDANYNRAVALYTKILAQEENQDTADALFVFHRDVERARKRLAASAREAPPR